MSREIARRAQGFWQAAGLSPTYPVDIAAAACWALPVGIVHVPDLRTDSLHNWLGMTGTTGRRLHGALLARRGRGLILVDGRDNDDERRLSIAHECSHFILEYLEPRERVVQIFGPAILDVLDGDRRPSLAERADSVLAGVPLGLQVHLLERQLHGQTREDELRAESQADALALELLAPEEQVRRRGGQGLQEEGLVAVLVKEFGLPAAAARYYSKQLLPRHIPSLRAWLGV